jgi:hypothetical protein
MPTQAVIPSPSVETRFSAIARSTRSHLAIGDSGMIPALLINTSIQRKVSLVLLNKLVMWAALLMSAWMAIARPPVVLMARPLRWPLRHTTGLASRDDGPIRNALA